MAERFDLRGKRVWVAGHRGMVGAALVRRLAREECEIIVAGRDELDLRDQAATTRWISARRPDLVFVAAARVGGILANASRPADFLYDNLLIETNVIGGAFQAGVRKLVFLGSSCIYPKFADQPIAEEALLTGPLEPTNEWYAIAKIAGIKLCEAFRAQHGCDFISAMPTNLYGPGDNFDLGTSHVLPALIRKAHEAKHAGRRTSSSGARGLRGASSSTSTTAPTRWCISRGPIPTTATSTSAPARTSRSATLPGSFPMRSASGAG